MTSRPRLSPRCALRSLGALAVAGVLAVAPALAEDGDWNQWGGSASRNNAPESGPLPIDWDPGQFDAETGAWKPETSRNIAWVAQLGSQSYGNPPPKPQNPIIDDKREELILINTVLYKF